VEPDWHYPELPPPLLPQLMAPKLSLHDDPELSRAIWFWLRRPKVTLYESRTALLVKGSCVLLALTIALVDWPPRSISTLATEVIILAFCVAIEIGAIMHRVRVIRWRREYELSVHRLIRTTHPPL
jgi:hypothetical protein